MKNTIILATFSVLLFTSCSKSGVDDNGTGNTTVVDACRRYHSAPNDSDHHLASRADKFDRS